MNKNRRLSKQKMRKNIHVTIPQQKRWIDRVSSKGFDVSGLSIEDILNIDPVKLMRLKTEQFKDITQRLVSASNKRIKYLESDEIGKISPAYQKYLREGRKFTSKFKDVFREIEDPLTGKKTKQLVQSELNQLRNEFARAKEFLSMKTSTKRGFKKLKKHFETELQADRPMTADEYKNFWEGYRKFEEEHKGEIISHKNDSLAMLREFYKLTTGKTSKKSFDEFIDNLYIEDIDRQLEREREEDVTDDFIINEDIWD